MQMMKGQRQYHFSQINIIAFLLVIARGYERGRIATLPSRREIICLRKRFLQKN